MKPSIKAVLAATIPIAGRFHRHMRNSQSEPDSPGPDRITLLDTEHDAIRDGWRYRCGCNYEGDLYGIASHMLANKPVENAA